MKSFAKCGLVLILVILTGSALAQAPNLQDGAPLLPAAWPSDPDKFTFAIFGDRTGGTPAEWPVFDRAVQELNILRPDFVIMVGDLIYGYGPDSMSLEEDWAEFEEHAEKLEIPFLYLPGNHDISSPEALEWWRKTHGRTYHSFDYKGCHFVLLNTHEAWSGGGARMGEEQVEWALGDLEASKAARHTFVFMHVPQWVGNDDPTSEWGRIENALQGRPHTVVAGHFHRLLSEERHDVGRYIVVAETKGERVQPGEELPELGNLSHYSLVTVEDGETSMAVIEPGAIWNWDVAPASLRTGIENMLELHTAMPQGMADGEVTAEVVLEAQNPTDWPIDLAIGFSGEGAENWTAEDPAMTAPVVLAPGETLSRNIRFHTASASLLPVPAYTVAATYEGTTINKIGGNIPLYPESALTYPAEYLVVGPYNAGTLPHEKPENPLEALPFAFEKHGPETGIHTESLFKGLEDEQLRAAKLPTVDLAGPGFVNMGAAYGVPYEDFAYAGCAVHSPDARTVYVRFRVDDYGQLFVNGEQMGDPIHRTRRNPEWIALDLREGWNSVVVKNFAISGGWTFQLLFADPDQELDFAAEIPR